MAQLNMKTIGIIGGLGPQATLDMLERIQKVCNRLIPQSANSGYPPIYVGFCREAPMAIKPDGSVHDPLVPSDELLMVADEIGHLTDFLIIASNTPHLFQKEIEKVSDRKVLSIVEITMEDVRRRGCKKVGILAVGETLRRRLYQDPLDAEDVQWEIIPAALSEQLDKSIFAVMEGNPTALDPAFRAISYLREQGADGIILGCTEIPLLLENMCGESYIINPSQLLAEAAVRYALEP